MMENKLKNKEDCWTSKYGIHSLDLGGFYIYVESSLVSFSRMEFQVRVNNWKSKKHFRDLVDAKRYALNAAIYFADSIRQRAGTCLKELEEEQKNVEPIDSENSISMFPRR